MGMEAEAVAETIEVTIGGSTPAGVQPAAQEFSGAPADFEKDLAMLAKEGQVPAIAPEVHAGPEGVIQEPVQPATATATPVPDKFKNPDGTVNEDRVAKSKDAALAEYARIERELRQKQNQLAQTQRPLAQQPQQVQTQAILTPLERSMAQDLINEAATFGQQMPEWQAIVQARVMARGLEAKHAAELNVTEDLRNRLADQERDRQLGSIADVDAWVFSPEGIKTLSNIRESRPHVNASREPWMTAYREYLADEAMTQRLGGTVRTPTPKPLTAKAPPTPVGGAPRAVVKPATPNFDSMSTSQISEYAKGLSPADETKFWRSRGLKF